MASGIIIEIKVKPHLKEFLEGYLGNPVLASSRNIIGILLEQMLEAPPRRIAKKEHGKSYVKISLPFYDSIDVQSKNYVSPENQKRFDQFIYDFFKLIFHDYVDKKVVDGFQQKDAIVQFCARYNISYNYISFEMLKKSYYRYKKSQGIEQKKNKKNHKGVSPRLSREITAKIYFNEHIKIK